MRRFLGKSPLHRGSMEPELAGTASGDSDSGDAAVYIEKLKSLKELRYAVRVD